jgi:hypothetical protein
VFRVDPAVLEQAARRDPLAALDWARWLVAQDRPADALAVLPAESALEGPDLRQERLAALAEARLASGDLAGAVQSVQHSGDADLAAEIAHRLSELRGTPWEARDPRERALVFGALCRRGRAEEALALARRVLAEPGVQVPGFVDFEISPAGLDPPARLARCARLRDLGMEERALAELGELLALDPANEPALGLYGELAVRRKLGLTEFPLPRVDWGGLAGS